MSILEDPHYEIPSAELAAWIEQQGEDTYWAPDGDLRLSGRLACPCSGEDLAADLRRINLPLLVLEPNQHSGVHGQVIGRSELDALTRREGDGAPFQGEKPLWANNRYLEMRWKDKDWDWFLVEDLETTAFWKRAELVEGSR